MNPIFIQVLFLALFGFAAAVAVFDIVRMLQDWFGRIHIGRYDDRHQWTGSIANIGTAWLNHTPVMKVTDNNRLVLLDMMQGNYKRAAIQHWQEGALLLGLSEGIKTNDSPLIRREIETFLHKHFDRDGRWRTKPVVVDAAMLAYAVMNVPFIDASRYQASFEVMWELIKGQIGGDGTVQYRTFMKNYRYVDTIGLICPFLIRYGTMFQHNECIELAVQQIKAYRRHGMLERHHIPFHAYDAERNIPLGLPGWGRGLAWYAIGLIDAWNELPSDHAYKSELEEYVRTFAAAAASFQQKGGHWNWTVTRSESRTDSSVTAAMSWFMILASRITDISHDCVSSAESAMAYLMNVTRRNGAIDFSQGDTKDIGVYSQAFNIMPFTQGFAMRTASHFQRSKVE